MRKKIGLLLLGLAAQKYGKSLDTRAGNTGEYGRYDFKCLCHGICCIDEQKKPFASVGAKRVAEAILYTDFLSRSL